MTTDQSVTPQAADLQATGLQASGLQAQETGTPAAAETQSGKNAGNENFPVGSFLIRPDLRRHVHAFYLFARGADDISDDPLLDPAEKIARLDRFAATLTDSANNDAKASIPLRESLAQTGVTPQHALDLLTAFKRDAVQLRYQDWNDLMDYCRYSASPVGRYLLDLHGVPQSAWPANDALCSALQVINHLQDCADDYRELDRVYLPADIMAAAGTDPTALSAPQSSPALRAALNAVLDRNDELMALAKTFPAQVTDRRLRAETAVIVSLAERMVVALRHKDPLCDNAKLGKTAVLGAALSGLLRMVFGSF